MEQLLRRTIGEHVEPWSTKLPISGRSSLTWPSWSRCSSNLAVNARDVMLSGGRLTIETANLLVDQSYAAGRPGVSPGHYVRFRVSDTGVGMDKSVTARAFEPFFTTKPLGQGTGLGLATIYGIIIQAGGDSQLYSEPGFGTTFSALIPATDQQAATPKPEPPELPKPGHETVLVADDEELIRELTHRILTRNGYHVIVATDSADAVEIVRERGADIDLLLADVVTPHMSDKELADGVVALSPDIRVLYMSGMPNRASTPPGSSSRPTRLSKSRSRSRSSSEASDKRSPPQPPAGASKARKC
jgi:two-component system cell cycle sensor histidine kinase/response regulator CckA